MHVIGIKTPIFLENNSLADFIKKHVFGLQSGDILVVTSKIVALSEGRTGKIEEKNKLIFKESKKVIETPWAFLTLNDEGWGINAGIDESNAEKKLIMLPKNSFETAKNLQKIIKKHYSLKKFGVLITDTRSVSLRVGTVGRALGFAGFEPIKSYIGKKDLFGRKSRVTKSNHADGLAAAAVLVMGEGNEQIPFVIIKNAPVKFTARTISKKSRKLALEPEKDIFSNIFTSNENQK